MADRVSAKDLRDEALRRLDVRAFFAQQGVVLGAKVGSNEFRFVCPVHGDSPDSPNANVNLGTGLWKCHVCDAGGSAIDLVMQTRGVDYKVALAEVAEAAGVELERKPRTNGAAHTNGAAAAPHVSSDLPGKVAAWHDAALRNAELLVWFRDHRGFTLETVIAYQLGWDGERVTIPIYDAAGELANVRRYLRDAPGDAAKMKWLLTGAKNVLYPLGDIDGLEEAIVVEGEWDAILLRQHGFPAITATGGAAVWTSEWSEALAGKRVVVCYDNDDAGIRGGDRVGRELAGIAAEVKVLRIPGLPPKGDVTDFFVEQGRTADELRTLIAATVPSIDAGAVVSLSTLDRTPPPPLLLERLDPLESTILFGPGGVGKGALACRWIVDLIGMAGLRVLILDYENHGSEWSRRIFGLGGVDALAATFWIAPLAAGKGAIWDHIDEVAEACVKLNIGYVVIDSAIMAAGGQDPLEPETPGKFNAALQRLGVPSLTLAHVTKLHDARYPFGSVFWHNLARVTWSLMTKAEDVLLTCRKANNYLKPSAQVVSVTWFEGVLSEVSERPAAFRLLDRIAEVLADGDAKSAVQLALDLNEGVETDEHTSAATIRKALSRELARPGTNLVRFRVDAAKRWSLRPSDDEEE